MATPAETYFARAAAPAAGARADAGGPPPADESGGSAAKMAQPPSYADFPCSPAQERFWLLDRLDPGNPSYNVAVRWQLEGRVSRELLQRAWLEIIRRHEILRTVFVEAEGVPQQRVLPHSPFKLVEIDLKHLAPDKRQTEADRIGGIEARAPFDLSSGPLVRATLLRLSATSSIILVTTHQIVSDGWSIGVMAREMGVIYEALRHGNAIPLEELPIQYADYSRWQIEWLRVRGTAAETAYWSKQLAGIKPFKVIPDRPRPAIPTTNGAIVSRVLPRELTQRAQILSAEQGATLFASVLAALCAMLCRFTGQDEVVVGTQVSDRDQVELEPMIGQFVNSLILRHDLKDDPRFVDLVALVRETSAQALEHRHIPIERLIGMVKSERGHASSAPISVNFIFQKTFIQNTRYSEFALIDLPSLPAGAIYDLNFFMVERTDGWRFSCQYNTDQFEADTAERLLDYFQSALESGIARPERRVSELVLSAPGEIRNLLARLNDTRSLYPRDLTLAKLFEAQAARTPAALAVACEDAKLSYAELEAAANRLAHTLTSRGITARAVVGVCLERSLDLPVALLGILKVGAVFMPLDPALSVERRAALVRASHAAAVIVEHIPRAATAAQRAKLVDLRAALRAAAPSDRVNLAEPPQADAPACLIYTFGGPADAIAHRISHRHLSNLICSLAKRPGLNDRDVLLATSPPGVDRAVAEMLLPLLNGAGLVLATDAELGDGRRLLHRLQRSGATVMHAGPQVWTRLMQSGWIGYPALKMLCSDLDASLAGRLLAMGGELWALHGYSGAGVWCGTLRWKPKQPGPWWGEPLGEPLANTAFYVLDSSLKTVPIGAIGTLYIAGDGIGGPPSNEAFASASQAATPGRLVVADPLGLMQRTTLFCTGDRVRLRASGQIEFLGRAPREEAVALPSSGAPAGGAAGRGATPLGGAAPMLVGDIETALAKIWAPMLGVERLTPSDNFFELGGHSLLAARMLTQLEQTFGRRLKLATLFAAPTIRELARVLARPDLREFDFRQMVKIQPFGSKPPLIAINNTGVYFGLAKCLGADQPVISLQLFDPSVTSVELPDNLEGVAAGYVELIRRVQPEGPYSLMGWCVAGALAFEIARQLKAAGQEVSHLFLIDSWVPRYFSRQSPLRGRIGDYTLRLQLIWADFRRVLRGEQSLSAFMSKRNAIQNLSRLLGGAKAGRSPALETSQSTPESYDRWLLAYLQRMTAQYEPGILPVRITLLRSREEPTGWLFRSDAGWGECTSAGVHVGFVDGDHFTMFKNSGVEQMARQIAAVLDEARNTPRDAEGGTP